MNSSRGESQFPYHQHDRKKTVKRRTGARGSQNGLSQPKPAHRRMSSRWLLSGVDDADSKILSVRSTKLHETEALTDYNLNWEHS
jgi:hypothetical protein